MTPPETLAEQEGIVRREIHLARNEAHALLEAHFDEIEEMAVARLREGFDFFGTAGWRKSPVELLQDIKEEFADALVYLVMRRWRRRHPQP